MPCWSTEWGPRPRRIERLQPTAAPLLVNLGRFSLGPSKRFDIEAGSVRRIDDHPFSTADPASRFAHFRGDVDRDHDGAVQISMNEIAMSDAHPGDFDRAREIHHMHECM